LGAVEGRSSVIVLFPFEIRTVALHVEASNKHLCNIKNGSASAQYHETDFVENQALPIS
jgi:hypothetical protein